jgi:phage/plasmid-associated DNA primase
MATECVYGLDMQCSQQELFAKYVAWCSANKVPPKSSIMFGRDVDALANRLKIKRERDKTGQIVRGVALK